ncbi:kinesin motor domain protein [Ceratobasidium sp. AG-Ba]|nr:kinesin motor domain protein [Ceratobasidium sp. AG-Ba]
MAPSASSGGAVSVQVAVRIRASTEHDLTHIPARFQRTVVHALTPTSVAVDGVSAAAASGNPSAAVAATAMPPKKQVFTFDQAHGPQTSQHQMFSSTAAPLVERFIQGFNCTILAYGQTSSGKTYTMSGIDLDADPTDPSNGMGIIPRAVSTVFAKARELKEERGAGWQYSLKGSFIELYNEDLIDLLGVEDSSGARREVQIREDKEGNIIWGGLREVPVKSAADVLGLIRQGTSLRRTNETDMNAQSSRSHAIFSLTLVQKKYTGTAPLPRPSLQAPSAGVSGRTSPMPSPSRLARPGSMFAGSANGSGRVGSPTFGRPATPSFAAAMGRGSGIRPASALGMRSVNRPGTPDEEEKPAGNAGEWTTVVSKFHFVDLAGSERLKRTAAQGDRVKEGISINGGLLALGNVISALGDPSKSRGLGGHVHVPYRDSKLTRLLQDSLGGNAHTLMIACVSPAEYNAAETINTLKYANRARNIKNRAEIKEKEEGWEDLEWLQGQVNKLRREVKALKEGGAVAGPGGAEAEEARAAKEQELQMLQTEYDDMRQRLTSASEELARLKLTLEDRGGATGGAGRYEDIVAPVIEEYEKQLSHAETQIALQRTAVRHTENELADKEQELEEVLKRSNQADLYIEELRVRLSKAADQERSRESYVRDLEQQIKTFTENASSSDTTLLELQKELAKYKETESTSAHYISEMEARLARYDEDIESLRRDMSKLEHELSESRERCKTMDALVQTLRAEREAERKDRDEWVKMLEARERKVEALESRMGEVERERVWLAAERERLNGVVGGVEKARRSLEAEGVNGINGSGNETPFMTPATEIPAPGLGFPGDAAEVEELRKQHAATLDELNTVNARYQDALRDISDLYAQINEAKLQQNGSMDDKDPPAGGLEVDTNGVNPGSTTPTSFRRRAGSRTAAESPGGSRRLFFRHAASSESLHTRSHLQSLSLSQELSSARSPKSLWAVNGSGPGSENYNGDAGSIGRGTGHRPQLSLQLPNERSADDLEKEIKSLQAILKTREAEIVALENTIKESEREASFRALSEGVGKNRDSLVYNPKNRESQLSPEMIKDFAEIRKSLELMPRENHQEADLSLSRLDELMRSMAQKESAHRDLVDGLNDELDKLRKQHEELNKLSKDQTLNMSTEMDALKSQLDASNEAKTIVTAELEEIKAREQDLLEQLRVAGEKHAAEIEGLKAEHAAELQRKETALLTQHQTHVSELQSGHETALAQAAALLATTRHEYAESLGVMQSEHDDERHKLEQEHEAAMSTLKSEHQAKVEELKAAHADALSKQTSEAETAAARAQEEHDSILVKLKADHAETLTRMESEGSVALQRLKDEHVAAMKQAEIAREGTLSDSQSSQALAIQQLQEEHLAAIARKETALKEDMENLKAEHTRLLRRRDEDHEAALKQAMVKHEAAMEDLRKAHAAEMDRISSSLQDAAAAHATALEQLRASHEEALKRKTQEHAGAMNEKELSYQHSFSQLKASHQAELAATQLTLVSNQVEHKDALESAFAERDELAQRLKEESDRQLAELQEQHAKEKAELQAAHELVSNELVAYKTRLEESAQAHSTLTADLESGKEANETALAELGRELGEVTESRAALTAEVEALRVELEKARSEKAVLVEEASKHQATTNELEEHRGTITGLQAELQKATEEREALEAERALQESLVKELQAQLAAAKTEAASETAQTSGPRPEGRGLSYGRHNGLPPAKLPPLTPPPSIPPPPLPSAVPPVPAVQDTISRTGTSASSHGDSTLDSSIAPSQLDSNAAAQLEKQAQQLNEAQAMIKTLNKQLTHCEGDLQAHMDLVATLETSLSDSERNLRKSRNQSMELVKERDSLVSQVQGLRAQLEEAQQEITQVRRTVVEEKHSLEQRLDDERRQKDRARQQLESRMEELQKRKSKFACI